MAELRLGRDRKNTGTTPNISHSSPDCFGAGQTFSFSSIEDESGEEAQVDGFGQGNMDYQLFLIESW